MPFSEEPKSPARFLESKNPPTASTFHFALSFYGGPGKIVVTRCVSRGSGAWQGAWSEGRRPRLLRGIVGSGRKIRRMCGMTS